LTVTEAPGRAARVPLPRTGASRGRSAAASDLALDLVVIAFATWTVVFHVCVALRIGATPAVAAWVIAAAACGWLAVGSRARSSPVEPAASRGGVVAPAAAGIAAVVAALLFAFGSLPWIVVWAAWTVAAACAVAAPRTRRGFTGATTRWETVVVAAWALGLAVLSLFVLAPDGDDGFYGHIAAWVAQHGSFPVRDVLYSNEVLPSLYYPPVSSWEGFVGALAHVTSIRAPDVLYFAAPPAVMALAVLALWRLLRRWAVWAPALALSVGLTFLLLDSERHQMIGAFFGARMWQGKGIFLAVAVPLMLALLHEYASRPSRRALWMLAAMGTAAVGLSTTAIFVVPVIAAAAMAVIAPRAPATAARGFAAAAAYPIAAAVVTLAVGGRTPDDYTDSSVVAGNLAHSAIGSGWPAFVALGAALAGPLFVPRAVAARMAAAIALAVAVLLAPPAPELIFHLTGLGRVLWRLEWALPLAALVGAVATGLLPSRLPAPVRALPALALAGLLVVIGQPVTSLGGVVITHHPVWKVDPAGLAVADRVLDHSRNGDVVLAPPGASEALAKISGAVTPVNVRAFYTDGLRDEPGGYFRERTLLASFATTGLVPPEGRRLRTTDIRAALRYLDVDIACVPSSNSASLRLLARLGSSDRFGAGGLTCGRLRQ
jgi:hypothetical protein